MKLSIFCLLVALMAAAWSKETQVSAMHGHVGLYGPDRYDGVPDDCLMPMDFGYCRAKVKRYYFDIRRMKCNMFYWGGCAGNVNNFKSLEECNKLCLDATAYEESDQRSSDKYNSYNSITNSKGASKNYPDSNKAPSATNVNYRNSNANSKYQENLSDTNSAKIQDRNGESNESSDYI